jgi:hypothetical protein
MVLEPRGLEFETSFTQYLERKNILWPIPNPCILLSEMHIERYLNIAFLAEHIITTVGVSFYQIWKMCKYKRGEMHGSAPMVLIYCLGHFHFLFPLHDLI